MSLSQATCPAVNGQEALVDELVGIDLITLDLKLAFKQPGCPLCRLRFQAAQRYLRDLLWENVNDAEIRGHLIHALGFCSEHAWQLQQTEETLWADGLGTGIIYEDLSTRALAGLEEFINAHERQPTPPRRHRTWNVWADRWCGRKAHPFGGRAADGAFPAGLKPQERCRVCEMLDEREATFLAWMIRGCAEAEFQGWYRESDGLCLPHLRQALVMAEREDPAVALFLARVSHEKLNRLTTQLREYLRKHSWQYHEEPISPEEHASWIRAVAFFAGEQPERMLK